MLAGTHTAKAALAGKRDLLCSFKVFASVVSLVIALVGCRTIPTRSVSSGFVRFSPPPGDLVLLSITRSANSTNTFHCFLPGTTWHASSNACPFEVTLVFMGPAGSNCVVEYQPELGYPQIIVTNAFVIGAAWCEVSSNIMLTGEMQTFSTGAFDPFSFYRLKLKP